MLLIPMITLGIDIGTAITGWAVVDNDPKFANKYRVYDYGAIFTEADQEMPYRLQKIYHDLSRIIDEFKPEHIAIEDLFFFKNQKTVIKVAQARGVVIVAAKNKGLEVFDYTPLQVKQAVTGYGRAEKKQVQQMVTKILGLKEVPKPDDTADALAISICHLNTFRL